MKESKIAIVARMLPLNLCRIALALLDLLLHYCQWVKGRQRGLMTHQSAHGAVKSMSVVPAELGVGALERRVTVRLGLLDTVVPPC